MFSTYTYTVHPILFVLQDAAAPRTITRGVEERQDWMSVDSSQTSKSVNLSLVSKTVDGGLPSKSSMDSDLNHRMALRVDCAEAGYGQNKVTGGEPVYLHFL